MRGPLRGPSSAPVLLLFRDNSPLETLVLLLKPLGSAAVIMHASRELRLLLFVCSCCLRAQQAFAAAAAAVVVAAALAAAAVEMLLGLRSAVF